LRWQTIGCADVQSTGLQRLPEDDAAVLQVLADQVAIAMRTPTCSPNRMLHSKLLVSMANNLVKIGLMVAWS
jgi:hypothetical protein